jgi:hypothetical protein
MIIALYMMVTSDLSGACNIHTKYAVRTVRSHAQVWLPVNYAEQTPGVGQVPRQAFLSYGKEC